MLILDNDKVLNFLNSENKDENGLLLPNGDKVAVTFKTEKMQMHLNFGCGCKITQDNKGSWWHPCPRHGMKAWEFRKEGFIHKHL